MLVKMRKRLTYTALVERQKRRGGLILHQRAIHEAARRAQFRSEHQRISGILASVPVGLREHAFLRDREVELKELFRDAVRATDNFT